MKPMNEKFYLISVFEYLDYHYQKGHEDLGGFIGGLCPKIFLNNDLPADPALFDDWCEILGDIKVDQMTPEEVYPFVLRFLKHEGSLGWGEIINFIKKEKIPNMEDKKVWLNSVLSVQGKIGTFYN